MMDVNKIVLGDCLEKIYELEEKSVNLILTDPPYNIGQDSKLTWAGGEMLTNSVAWGNSFNDNRSESDYGLFIKNLSDAFDYVLAEEGSIITFFDRGKPYYLKPLYDAFSFRNMIIFVKKNPSPHLRKNNYRSTFEQCAWFSREKYNINFLSQRNMKNVFSGLGGRLMGSSMLNENKKTEHPTEKYEWMIQPLVKRHSNPGDLILDPMCGSGTTCAVAKKMGRKYIGIEIDEGWFKVAQNRVNNTSVNLESFGVWGVV